MYFQVSATCGITPQGIRSVSWGPVVRFASIQSVSVAPGAWVRRGSMLIQVRSVPESQEWLVMVEP